MDFDAPKVMHRRVHPRIWDSQDFVRLSGGSPCAQTLFLRLLTCREYSNIPGVILLGELGLAENMQLSSRWEPLDTLQCLRELEGGGLVKVDRRAKLIWLPRADRQGENRPANPNMVKGWASTWSVIPACPLKLEIHASLKELTASLGANFAQAFAVSCPRPVVDVASSNASPAVASGTLAQGALSDQRCGTAPDAQVSEDVRSTSGGNRSPKGTRNRESERDRERDGEGEGVQGERAPQRRRPREAQQALLPEVRADGGPSTLPDDIRFPVKGKTEAWRPSEDQLERWRLAYPRIDLVEELRKASTWAHDNPGRIKENNARFIGSWLSRADKDAKQGGSAPPPRTGGAPSTDPRRQQAQERRHLSPKDLPPYSPHAPADSRPGFLESLGMSYGGRRR